MSLAEINEVLTISRFDLTDRGINDQHPITELSRRECSAPFLYTAASLKGRISDQV